MMQTPRLIHRVPAAVMILLAAPWILRPAVLLAGYDPPKDVYSVISSTKDQITARHFTFAGDKQIDVSDINISPDAGNSPTPFQIIYLSSDPDYKMELLTRGLATLRDPNTAKPEYRAAQEKAKSELVGIWALDKSTTQAGTFQHGFATITQYLGTIIGYLVSTGVALWIIQAAIRTIFFRKKVNLLLLGEAAAGKTAIFLRLVDAHAPREKILDTEPTKAVVNKEQHFIPLGKYEITPKLTDIPGTAYGAVWDAFTPLFAGLQDIFPKGKLWDCLFLRTDTVIVMVVAPSKRKSSSNGSTIDSDYVAMQRGYLQANIGGIVGARKTQKPKIIILFINKFDLISSHPPTDSASTEHKSIIQETFSVHCSNTAISAQNAGIPWEVVIGSALENWNCDRIMELIKVHLYAK